MYNYTPVFLFLKDLIEVVNRSSWFKSIHDHQENCEPHAKFP